MIPVPQALSLIDRYAAHLPVTARTPRITLGEGNTPLLRAPSFERECGIAEVWLKVEGANPTGSFKDRGMVVAVAKAMEEGSRAILCASTGNTAASAAAYAARAGLRCAVVLPAGHVALGKLSQAIAFGARVVAVRGAFDDALAVVRELGASGEVTLVNSINPHRIEGQKTAAFEVCEVLEGAPDALFIPVGNAGNITAYWRGFTQARAGGMSSSLPRMYGFQAEGAAPIVRGTQGRRSADRRHRDPHRRSGVVEDRGRRARRIGRRDRSRERRGDHGRVPRCRRARGSLLRTGERRVAGRAAQARGLRQDEGSSAGRVRPHRQRPQRSGRRHVAGRRAHRGRRDRARRPRRPRDHMRVRVPASSANLGPGFDSFAVALPLLAEFEVRAAAPGP